MTVFIDFTEYLSFKLWMWLIFWLTLNCIVLQLSVHLWNQPQAETLKLGTHTANFFLPHTQTQSKAGPTDVAFWPAVEVSLECFHVILPRQDYSSTLLLSVGALQATSSLDYAGPDVRFVLNNSAYHRLSLLSSERKQPPLPAYQLDAFAISLWGLTRDSNTGRWGNEKGVEFKLCYCIIYQFRMCGRINSMACSGPNVKLGKIYIKLD